MVAWQTHGKSFSLGTVQTHQVDLKCCTNLQMRCNHLTIWQGTRITHWGRVTQICISKLTIIGSDNGLSPDWRQVIIWTNARIIVNWNLRNKRQWNLKQNSYIFINKSAFKYVICEMVAALSPPQCDISSSNGCQPTCPIALSYR